MCREQFFYFGRKVQAFILEEFPHFTVHKEILCIIIHDRVHISDSNDKEGSDVGCFCNETRWWERNEQTLT